MKMTKWLLCVIFPFSFLFFEHFPKATTIDSISFSSVENLTQVDFGETLESIYYTFHIFDMDKLSTIKNIERAAHIFVEGCNMESVTFENLMTVTRFDVEDNISLEEINTPDLVSVSTIVMEDNDFLQSWKHEAGDDLVVVLCQSSGTPLSCDSICSSCLIRWPLPAGWVGWNNDCSCSPVKV